MQHYFCEKMRFLIPKSRRVQKTKKWEQTRGQSVAMLPRNVWHCLAAFKAKKRQNVYVARGVLLGSAEKRVAVDVRSIANSPLVQI